MLQSIKSSEQALQDYVNNENYEILTLEKKTGKQWVRPIFRLSSFFNDITLILRILTLIHEAQIMSESDDSNLILVQARWQTLETNLISQRESLEAEGAEFDAIYNRFRLRQRK
jgi:hypothetical protein